MSKMAMALLGVVFLGVGVVVWTYMSPPQQMAGHSMVPPDTSNIAPGDPIVQITLPETLSPQAQIGERVFNDVCARCHGENGTGRNELGPPLVHQTYRPGHHADMAFVVAARNGVRAHHWNFGNMPPIMSLEPGLTDGDVRAVVTYIRELQRANGIM